MNNEEQNIVLNDVMETIKECTKTSGSLFYPKFTNNSAMYAFTTENLAGYIRKLKLKNKKVLTVTSSGDHLLNLVINGVSNVDCFDINKNAYYFSELKIAALKSLSYDEFFNFFTACEDMDSGLFTQTKVGDNPNSFNYNLYQKIRGSLSDNVLLYWDLLYKKFNNDGKKLYDTVCIAADRKAIILNNDYLKNEENYENTKRNITSININYFVLDALNLHNINKKYDAILLSNIYDYLVSDYYNVISADEFNNYVENKLSKILEDNGIIATSYQYHYKIRKKNNIYNRTIKDVLKGKYELCKRGALDKLNFKKILVPSIIKEYRKNGEMDCLYLYNKSR